MFLTADGLLFLPKLNNSVYDLEIEGEKGCGQKLKSKCLQWNPDFWNFSPGTSQGNRRLVRLIAGEFRKIEVSRNWDSVVSTISSAG